MELCIGMICGSIPPLRPLFMSESKASGANHDAIKLTSCESQHRRVASKTLPSLLPYRHGSTYSPTGAISDEQPIVPYEQRHIGRTLEVEISHRAADRNDETLGKCNYEWNIV